MWFKIIGMMKVLVDYLIASVAIVVFSPVMLIIWILIRLDGNGPALFRQKRHGLNGQIINIWKFRSMHAIERSDEFKQAVENDERITRLGRFLRKFGLDELPQLLNVLSGDMSLVGPRPHPVELDAEYIGVLKNYEHRLRVKPGITGWAQVNGLRGPTSDARAMEQRLQYDLDYIQHQSLLFDLKIIALTPLSGLLHKTAF